MRGLRARAPGGVRWVGLVAVLVVVQVAAGLGGEDAPWLGLVHGLGAFALLAAALLAARSRPADHTRSAVAATP